MTMNRQSCLRCCKSISYRVCEAFEINPLQILGAEFCRAEIEFYFFDRAPEIFWEYFCIFEFRYDRETVIGADIHAFVRGEPERDGVFHFQIGLLFAVDEQASRAAGAELARFISGELIANIDFSRGYGVTRTDGVEFQA